jgi:hypothetical protein
MRIFTLISRLPRVILETTRKFLERDAVLSYSQEGEDMLLRRIFENQPRGFYVEVGAPHPIRFSNSFYFYKLGWSGINIEATPGAMSLFRILRPRDTNLEAAVSRERGPQEFFLFDEPALNTFDRELARQWESCGNRMIGTEQLVTRPLGEILADHIPEGKRIDFLSIDVEGMDFDVLQSNDWQRFRPKVLLVEMHGVCIEDVSESKMYCYLKVLGYELYAKCILTFLFKDKLQA